MDMGVIANTLGAFLGGDSESAAPTAMIHSMMEPQQHQTRGSTDLGTDLGSLQQELSAMKQHVQSLQSTVQRLESALSAKGDTEEELNGRVVDLENLNHKMAKEIEYLQRNKTELAVESTKAIDIMRGMLISYQASLRMDR